MIAILKINILFNIYNIYLNLNYTIIMINIKFINFWLCFLLMDFELIILVLVLNISYNIILIFYYFL